MRSLSSQAGRQLTRSPQASAAAAATGALLLSARRPCVSHAHASFAALGLVSPLEMSRAAGVPPRVAVPEGDRLDRVLSNLRTGCSVEPQKPVSSKFAAVLVPLFDDEDGEIHVVLTRRSSRLNTHAGEVCFPGGKRDPGDADDTATALREAHEELGLDPVHVQVVGCLPAFLSKHLLSVTPVLGVIPSGLRFRPNAAEVESVFSAPLRMFLEAGPGYRSRDVEWAPGVPYRLHYFDYEFEGRSFLIWGLTAGMLIVVAELAYGRPPEFQASPPGALPYTALSFNGQRLEMRGGLPTGASADALQLASAAATTESPPSAAMRGGVVTQAEAEAAVPGTAEGEEADGGSEQRARA